MVAPARPWPRERDLLSTEMHRLCNTSPWKDVKSFFCTGLDEKGFAAKIMAAIYQNAHDELELLLSRTDVLPDFVNGHGHSPLMIAAARNNVAAVRLLAAHPLVALDRRSHGGASALHYAAWSDASDSAALLLKHGADFTLKMPDGKTAYALAKSKETEKCFLHDRRFARALKKSNLTAPAKKPAQQKPVDYMTGNSLVIQILNHIEKLESRQLHAAKNHKSLKDSFLKASKYAPDYQKMMEDVLEELEAKSNYYRKNPTKNKFKP